MTNSLKDSDIASIGSTTGHTTTAGELSTPSL